MSRMSTRAVVEPAPRSSSHSSRLALLIVAARTPMRSAASIWLRMRASSGDTSSVGPAAPVAQHAGGDEVDGALAPAGALHEQHPLPLADQPPDDVELVGPELARRVARQPPEQPERLLVEPGVTHLRTLGGDGRCSRRRPERGWARPTAGRRDRQATAGPGYRRHVAAMGLGATDGPLRSGRPGRALSGCVGSATEDARSDRGLRARHLSGVPRPQRPRMARSDRCGRPVGVPRLSDRGCPRERRTHRRHRSRPASSA